MTKQQKESNSLLDKVKPKITEFNKKFVILCAGALALVILLIIFTALRHASHRQQRTHQATINTTFGGQQPASNIADKLPEGYQNVAAIRHLLDQGQGTELPDSVKKELTELRSQQAAFRKEQMALEQKLSGMKSSRTTSAMQSESSVFDLEAQRSSIFFAGGAPLMPSESEQQRADATSGYPHKTGEHDAVSSTSGKDGGSYEKQNMQGQKLSFLISKPDKNIYNANAVQYPVSKYEIQAGSEIPAILDTQINSDVPGMIVAVVSQNVYDSIRGQYLLIPKGAKLIGVYNSQISYGQSILQAKFTRLIRPDGSSIVLPSQPAVDDMGSSGMSDTVYNHWGSVIGSAVLSTIFNIPAIVATNQLNRQYVYQNGSYVPNPSIGTTAAASALQSVGQTASQVGAKLTDRSLNVQPTVVIHAGYRFSVMVSKDIVLPPYHMPIETIPNLGGA